MSVYKELQEGTPNRITFYYDDGETITSIMLSIQTAAMTKEVGEIPTLADSSDACRWAKAKAAYNEFIHQEPDTDTFPNKNA